MRRSLTLLFALPSFCAANLGDWKLWTSVKEARNAVVRGQTVLIATGGGVVEWSASRSKQKVFTTLDGLPELDIISVLADDAGAIWAVGGTGRLAKLASGSTRWEPTGSYAASNWRFKTSATTYWKGFLILGGKDGLSLFSTKSNVAVDNISSIQGKTIEVSSALVVNDTLWVATNKGTVYCAPDKEGWAALGTPGHYLTDPSRWKWHSEIPEQMLFRTESQVVVLNNISNFWADAAKNFSTDGQKFTWKGGAAWIPGAAFAIDAPGGGYLVASSFVGPVHVKPDGTWNPMELDGNFPFHPIPRSVAIDASGNLYALGQFLVANPALSRTALARRPSGSYTWILDTIQLNMPDSTGKMGQVFPFWDPGETKGRARFGLDVEATGRVVTSSWVNDFYPKATGVFLSSQPGKWSLLNSESDTCLISLVDRGSKSMGTVLYGSRSRPDGVWLSQLEHEGVPNAQAYPMRVHHLPLGSNGPIKCWDLPGTSTEFQTSDLLPIGNDLWLATDNGLKRIANLKSKPSGTTLPTPSSPEGAASGEFVRLERFPVDGKDWILAAGSNVLGLVDPATDSFHAATNGTNQEYRALAVDSKMQIWAAGNAGIDIFQVVMEQDTNGRVEPLFEKVRRITRVDGLPENEINDFRLDSATGRALIATDNAIVLWASPFHSVTKKLEPSKVKVWPNPVRLSQSRGLFVDGVSEQAEFSLIAQDGTMVYHLPAGKQTTGMFQLELPMLKNLRPGLYFWTVKDGKDIARGPLLIGY